MGMGGKIERDLSLLTVPLHFKQKMKDLSGISDAANFAKRAGYQAIDISLVDGRDFSAETAIVQDVLARPNFYREGVERITGETGIKISGVTYCKNPLGNAKDRKGTRDAIEAGSILGAPTATIFIGNVWDEMSKKGLTKAEDQANYFTQVLKTRIRPLVRLGEERGIEVAAEGCPMWLDMRGGELRADVVKNGVDNLFHDRVMWRQVLSTVPGLKKTYDFSHRENYAAPTPDNMTGREWRNDIVSEDVREFGPNFGGTNHWKEGEDIPETNQDLTNAGAAFIDNTHMRDLTKARAPHAGRRGVNGYAIYVGDLEENAPQCRTDTVELEDVDVDFLNREEVEESFTKTAEFHGEVMDEVNRRAGN